MKKLYWLMKKTAIIDYSYKLGRILKFANMFFYVLMFYFVGQMVDKGAIPILKNYGGEYFSFVLFGIAFNSFFNVSRNTFTSSLHDEQVLGTMEPLIATGTSVPKILIGLFLYDFLNVTIQVSVMFFFGITFFGVKIIWTNLLMALLILLISILSFIGFGLISSAFVLVFKKGDPLGWFIGHLSVVMSGVYYPVEVLPSWLQTLANFLPLTHALKAVRLVLLKGASLNDVINEIYALILFIVILLPVSLLCLRFALKKVIIEGTLSSH